MTGKAMTGDAMTGKAMTGNMLSRRGLLKGGGVLVVGFALAGGVRRAAAQMAAGADALAKTIDGEQVDGFLAFDADGGVTLFSGKVDLGTGLRIAIRQMAAEELGLAPDRIALIEGDTALTPDQGPTGGSTGVARGGVQIRRAAATARQALRALAAERLQRPAADLDLAEGRVAPIAGGAGIAVADLLAGRQLEIKLDPEAPLRDPRGYRIVGQKLPRPDLPAKVTGRHIYVHDWRVPGMLHGRAIRPPAVGATLLAVDEASLAGLWGVRVVRLKDFLGVVAEDEWTAVRAARALKAEWSDARTLIDQQHLFESLQQGPILRDQVLVTRGDAAAALAGGVRRLTARYEWPVQSHASMGPSCAVADVRPDGATLWTASQATHRFRPGFARFLGLPLEKVRLIYLDGAGCYGMNGHDDAAADAALLSQVVGQPVRVQWMREDEHGWDPKGPPQLLELRAAQDAAGDIVAWETEMWLPLATAGLPNVPLLGPAAAGRDQAAGLSTGLIDQNGDPPYAMPNLRVLVHWLKDAPLRPANIRAPGKIANSFAVESFTDELAAAAGADPVAYRLARLTDPRGIEVVKRAAAGLGWDARPSPRRPAGGVEQGPQSGRGFAYVHYKHAETYVALAIAVEVDPKSGQILVRRVVCAHDCGLVINPDALANQIEGAILQTLSRTLHEEVTFDRARVTSVDWASYPILTFPEVPAIAIDLVDRPLEPPLGAGEAASTPVAAALANAVFDATGLRLRTVPLTPARVKAALKAQGA